MRDSLIEHGGAGTEKRRYGFLLLSLCVFVMVLIMTEMTPLVADDYDYAFSWAFHWSYFMRIDNLKLLWDSMETHRLFTHGRVFASGWATLFLMKGMPEWAFSVANAAVCTAFTGFSMAFSADWGANVPWWQPLRCGCYSLDLHAGIWAGFSVVGRRMQLFLGGCSLLGGS